MQIGSPKSVRWTDNANGWKDRINMSVSAVKVNNMHLPLAEYVVNGETYKVRVPYEIAVVMESEQNNEAEIVRANFNFGTHIKAQLTGIQGRKVQISYDPTKPHKGYVTGYENLM